jgi:cytochrome P450
MPQDVLDPRTARDPLGFFARLRSEDPVHWDAGTSAWYVTRFADVERLLLDTRLGARSKAELLARTDPVEHGALHRVEGFLAKWLVFSDPPYQARLRRAVSGAFTPRELHGFDEYVARAARRHTAALLPGANDLLASVVRPYTLDVTCALLGIADADRSRVLGWSDALMRYLSQPIEPARTAAAAAAVEALTEHVTAVVLPRGGGPLARLLGGLHRAGALTDVEVAATFTQLLTGGVEPVATAAAVGLEQLLAAPGQWALLRTGQVGYEAAVEEVFRFASPFHFAPRTATADLEIAGRRVRRGERVVLVLAAANRDPEVFADPEAFDIGREARRHLAFGLGGHFCLGSVLARMELRHLLEALDERFPTLAPGPVAPVRLPALGMTVLGEVPCLV